MESMDEAGPSCPQPPPQHSEGTAIQGFANLDTVTMHGLPLQVLRASLSTQVGGGDCTRQWHAKLRYYPPSGKSVEWIEFAVAGSELNSERYDRDSHSVEAQLSTGEKLTLYKSEYNEKYSRMQNGPGNAKDESEDGRTKLAECLSALTDGAFGASDVQQLAQALDSKAEQGALPGTVKTNKQRPQAGEGRTAGEACQQQ